MERSQSYTSFDTSINNSNNNNKNNNNNACESNLRKALELRQTQLQQQQQQQQQQMQLHQHNGSGDNTNSNNNNNLTNFHSLPVPMRRKLLQRQKSTEFPDDLNYAGEEEAEQKDDDYEEEEELRNDDDDVYVNDDEQNFVQPQLPPSNKQVRFQKHKPNSDSALIKDDANAAIKFKSVEANINIIVDVADNNKNNNNNNNNKNKNITIKYPLKHKQTSFDSAILNAKPGTAAGSACRRNHPCNAQLRRNNSIHSDSSCYSSVDSLLEARKPDPEAILINLGFGPMPGSEDILSKIPKRFLKPSQVRGIDTNAFVKRIQLAHSLADHSSMGYRGLIGNPDLRPSTIVGKIMERFEVNQRKKSMGSAEHTIR